MANWIKNFWKKKQLEQAMENKSKEEILKDYIKTEKTWLQTWEENKEQNKEAKQRKQIIEAITILTEVITITEDDGTLIGKKELLQKNTNELLKLFEGMINEAEKNL